MGEMACDIPLIISHHPDSEWLANFHDLRFYDVPVSTDDKHAAEQIQPRLRCDHQVNLVVLARTCRFLSTDLSAPIPTESSTFTIRHCRRSSGHALPPIL
jgi:formyltetrahydrofolate deformylase